MRFKAFVIMAFAATMLSACQQEDVLDVSRLQGKPELRLTNATLSRMKALNMDRNSPIMIRIFKEEGVMEVWKANASNRYALLKSYQICAWSGMLGPKKKEGDRQAPEGFYDITKAQMNPNSRYYLAFNIGYPNAYDRSLNRGGTNLMVHGACSSSGCYSMTDAQVQEIFALANDAFAGGQQAFQIQALPFRMTADNMARHKNSPNIDFWKMLKIGYDQFEISHRPPVVNVCNHTYVFNQIAAPGQSFNPSGACPATSTPPEMAQAYSAYEAKYNTDYAAAEKKYAGYIWDEPTEAQRKAAVAGLKKKSTDLAFAPTGNGLQAGKLVKIEEFQAEEQKRAQTEADKALAEAAIKAVEKTKRAPVPQANPIVPAAQPTTASIASNVPENRPFWKLWN
ncbi:L,D-transpeptidase family protein [Rhizobium sp. C1]|uniref:L,D-transpeptidase family protein n=1 Tax=Rhizobium sp. C1 TaxID=1349799 RepID=UPI001E2F6F03|nr:murein L,D-transpeptidase family protein [Rhizobium sp. C1]MCD2178411.1 murein L,D-transpeptidase [Rhizobium sp. C1]